ncbi:Ras-related protein RABC2a [Vitis vinifera]|uniref:Ras-related protein RABC2a n=1 Tax=Vitis vinifera TaxID=29760 RepID=A0A438JSY6_VITVI|nr:Ras-related protein RABC2a [Vitis vinifera]
MVLKDLIKAFLWWEVLADAYILFFVLVYDVTRRESFTNLSDVWAKEVELYSTNQDCVKMLVGNKVDRVSFVISASMLKNWIPEEELLNGLWLWVYMPALCHLDRLQHFTAAKESERVVSREEGIALAKEHGCLFFECSAKTREKCGECFEELALKIMEVPSLLEEGSTVGKRNILKPKPENQPPPTGGCCS